MATDMGVILCVSDASWYRCRLHTFGRVGAYSCAGKECCMLKEDWGCAASFYGAAGTTLYRIRVAE
jgi:hypothetical protein